MSTISQTKLIKRYDHVVNADQPLMHLSKTPMKWNRAAGRMDQLHAYGYNIGGRSDGLWLAYGMRWLNFAAELDNPAFPDCCYLYEMRLSGDANILHIRSLDDLRRFDEQTPSYWLNFDYFTFEYTDYLTGENILWKATRHAKMPTSRAALVKAGIIFESAPTAAQSAFYGWAASKSIPVERFKYKDWAMVSKQYDGIAFHNYDRTNADLMYYVWYQSLDIPSACIWNPAIIEGADLRWTKVDASRWKRIDL